MNRSRRILALWLPMVSACASAPPPEAPPPAATTADTAIVDAPSLLAALGVTDSVSVAGSLDPKKVKAAFADHHGKLVECLRDALERDQALAGDLRYAFTVGADGKLTLSGTDGSLSALPAAKCGARTLLASVLPGAGADTKIEYRLAFAGSYQRAPRTAADIDALGSAAFHAFDIASGKSHFAASNALSKARSELVACLLGDDRSRHPRTWHIGVAHSTGTVSLLAPGLQEAAAAYCVRSKLGRMMLPATSAGVFLSVAVDARHSDGITDPLGAGLGDAFGTNGLGMSGLGMSGVGMSGVGMSGVGIGGGGVGATMGASNTKPGTLGGGTPVVGGNHQGGSPGKQAPSVRVDKASVRGTMDELVIGRVVRRNIARFRFCYEKALQKQPAVKGRIETTFVINTSGDVASAKLGSSTITENEMTTCVQRAFMGITFPKPENGIVVVNVPLVFAPPGAPEPALTNKAPALPSPPAPQPKTIAGITFGNLDGPAFSRKLGRPGRAVVSVPGASPPVPPIAFVREAAGPVAVVTRVSGTVTSACSVSDAGFSVVVHAADETACRAILRELIDREP